MGLGCGASPKKGFQYNYKYHPTFSGTAQAPIFLHASSRRGCRSNATL